MHVTLIIAVLLSGMLILAAAQPAPQEGQSSLSSLARRTPIFGWGGKVRNSQNDQSTPLLDDGSNEGSDDAQAGSLAREHHSGQALAQGKQQAPASRRNWSSLFGKSKAQELPNGLANPLLGHQSKQGTKRRPTTQIGSHDVTGKKLYVSERLTGDRERDFRQAWLEQEWKRSRTRYRMMRGRKPAILAVSSAVPEPRETPLPYAASNWLLASQTSPHLPLRSLL